MSELDGFVLYKPKPGIKNIHISIRKRGIGITQTAVEALGGSEYINVFFDDHRRRVMLKHAEADYPNIIRIRNYARSGLMINNLGIAEKLRTWYGPDARILGHVAGDGILIFEEEK